MTLDDGVVVRYGALCVATGASPRCPLPETCDGDGVDVHEVRDVESAEALARRVSESARASSSSSTRRIALAGNGGIALELVDALCGRGMALDGLESCELVWLVKHASVGDAFFDVDVADFLARALELRRRRDDGRRQGGDDRLVRARAVVVVDVFRAAARHVGLGAVRPQAVLGTQARAFGMSARVARAAAVDGGALTPKRDGNHLAERF